MANIFDWFTSGQTENVSSRLPGMFAAISTGAPGGVFWDMLTGGKQFEDALEDNVNPDPFNEFEISMGGGPVSADEIELTDEYAIEKAIYQLGIAQDQGTDASEIVNTPHGPPLTSKELDAMLDEYPGILATDYNLVFDQFDNAGHFLDENDSEVNAILNSVSDSAMKEGKSENTLGLLGTVAEQVGNVLLSAFVPKTAAAYGGSTESDEALTNAGMSKENDEDDESWIDAALGGVKGVLSNIKDFWETGTEAHVQGQTALAEGYQDMGAGLATGFAEQMENLGEMTAGNLGLMPSESTIEMNQLADLPANRIISNLLDAGYNADEVEAWLNSPGWRITMEREGHDAGMLRQGIEKEFNLVSSDNGKAMYQEDADFGLEMGGGQVEETGKPNGTTQAATTQRAKRISELMEKGYNEEQATYVVDNNVTADSAWGATMLSIMIGLKLSPEDAQEYWDNMDFPGDISGMSTSEAEEYTTAANEAAKEGKKKTPEELKAEQARLAELDTSETAYQQDLRRAFWQVAYAQPGGGRADRQTELTVAASETKTLFFLEYGKTISGALRDATTKDDPALQQEGRKTLEARYKEFLTGLDETGKPSGQIGYFKNPQYYRSGTAFNNKLSDVRRLLKQYQDVPDTTDPRWTQPDLDKWVWIQPLFSETSPDAQLAQTNRRNLIKMSVTQGQQGYYSNLIKQSAMTLLKHHILMGKTGTDVFSMMTRGVKPQTDYGGGQWDPNAWESAISGGTAPISEYGPGPRDMPPMGTTVAQEAAGGELENLRFTEPAFNVGDPFVGDETGASGFNVWEPWSQEQAAPKSISNFNQWVV